MSDDHSGTFCYFSYSTKHPPPPADSRGDTLLLCPPVCLPTRLRSQTVCRNETPQRSWQRQLESTEIGKFNEYFSDPCKRAVVFSRSLVFLMLMNKII